MIEIAPGWALDVDRGPDWVFARLRNPDHNAASTPSLAEALWELLRQNAVYRLVIELDQLEVLYTYLIGQLVLLHKRICVHGGAMRLCGLSPHNQEVLRLCRMDERFPPYGSREDAVMGRQLVR